MQHLKFILGVDPGNEVTAFQLLSDGKPLLKYNGIYTNERFLSDAIRPEVTAVFCEEIRSYGMPVGKTTFDTCRFTGRIEQLCFSIGTPFYLVGRKEIVTWLCGSSKAKDSNVRQALIDLYGEPGNKKNPGSTYGIAKDVWSALAIASYGHHVLKK